MEELAPVLAHHFNLAGKEKQAQKYFTLAGDVARRMNALAEAVEHYAQALAVAVRQAGCATAELIYLFEQYGRSLEIASRYEEAEANYRHMAEVAMQRQDRPMILAATIARATVFIVPSALFDPPRGQQLLQEGLALAQELGDKTAETRILWNLMLQTLHQHIPHFRRRQAFGPLPPLLYYQGRAWQAEGELDKAKQSYQEAISLTEQTHALHSSWPSLAALSQIEPELTVAQQWRQQAQATIQKIAHHAPPELRQTVLHLQAVQAVFE